jgi:hypothetical protein
MPGIWPKMPKIPGIWPKMPKSYTTLAGESDKNYHPASKAVYKYIINGRVVILVVFTRKCRVGFRHFRPNTRTGYYILGVLGQITGILGQQFDRIP